MSFLSSSRLLSCLSLSVPISVIYLVPVHISNINNKDQNSSLIFIINLEAIRDFSTYCLDWMSWLDCIDCLFLTVSITLKKAKCVVVKTCQNVCTRDVKNKNKRRKPTLKSKEQIWGDNWNKKAKVVDINAKESSKSQKEPQWCLREGVFLYRWMSSGTKNFLVYSLHRNRFCLFHFWQKHLDKMHI